MRNLEGGVRLVKQEIGAVSPTPDGELTDLQNARRFAQENQQELLYVTKSRQWLVWDGKRWRPDETEEVKRRAKATVERLLTEASALTDSGQRDTRKKLAIRAQSANRIAGMIELARSEPGIPITQDLLDGNPWLLNVQNGTVDLRCGILRRHRRKDLITRLAPVTYDPSAGCPQWEAFLDRIMAGDKELIRYVQKVLGYALTGVTREQCFFILHGTGANGKSTLTTVVAKVVGGYSQHTPTQTLLVRRSETIPNDVARLHGARLVTAAEAECDRQLAEALVKQLTGGDKIAARFLHGEFFEFVPSFKLFLAVNHKPEIRGTDNAIWRRIRLIPFDVTIPQDEQDRRLPEKLEAERVGILRWLVEGCLAWQEEGLEPPAAVKAATAEYRDEMDTVGAFIDECCVLEPETQTLAKRLYDAYNEWCAERGETPISKQEFGSRLAEKRFKRGRTKAGRYWQGLRLGWEVTQ
jgi:putative DNA primase/helicase